MRNREHSLLKGAGFAYTAGVVSLLLALILLQLGVHGYIAIETRTVASLGLVLFAASAVAGTGLTIGDTFSYAPIHRLSELRDPVKDELARLVTEESSGSETLIYGKASHVVRKVLLDNWPLDRRLLRERWCVLDSNDNDVTDLTFSDFEGVLRLVFD